MLKEREIRDQLASYLADEISLAHLSAWVYGVALDMEPDSPRTRKLAYSVLGRVAEQSTAGSGEDILRDELREIARIILSEETDPVRRESSSRVLVVP